MKIKSLPKSRCFAEENLFRVFSIPVLKGNPDQALVNPFTVMVSDEMVKKYFGNEDPMDKMMQVDGQLSAKISGDFSKISCQFALASRFSGVV